MSGTRRRVLPVVGVSAVGLAVGVAAGGLYQGATAEPIREPLLPVALSQPKDDQPVWTTARQPDPPKVPTLPPPKPQPAAPASPGVPPPPPLLAVPPVSQQAVREEAPPPRAVRPTAPATPEVAPPARPVNSTGPMQPVTLPQPVFNLRPTEPRHNVNASGPTAPPATGTPTGLVGPPVIPAELPSLPTRSGAHGSPASLQTPPPPAPGDASMELLTSQFALSAVLGAALATAPISPVAAQDKGQTDQVKKDDQDVKKLLEGIRNDLNSLKTSQGYLEDAILGKKDGTGAGPDAGLIKRFDDLDRRLKAVESALARLGYLPRETGDRSTSGFGPGTGGGTGTVIGRAYVRIVNDYPTDTSLIVNGKSYRLAQGETRTVEVPPGSYTYELLHAGSQPTTSTIKEGETVTLRIR